MTGLLLLLPLVCPVAPKGIASSTDMIAGNVLWVVIWMFGIATFVSVGAMLVGRIFHAPHISKGGAMGLAGVVGTAIVLMVIGGIIAAIIGSGCVQ